MTDADDPARKIVVNLALVAVGTVGAYRGAYELLAQQARTARRVIPKPTSRPFDGDGLYRPGAVTAEPWRPGMTCDVHMVIFGDSLAAGLGADSPGELPGVLLARGLAEEAGWNVRLSIKAIVGATSKGLAGQVEAMQIAHGDPDISVILIGGNDITARNAIGPSARRVGEAVEALRGGGSHVVVGTCPDLGTIKPVPQPLRSVM
ncbi:SGNH/GDSL hydrolase family protein, partial [Dietzia sp. DQ11-38-2]